MLVSRRAAQAFAFTLLILSMTVFASAQSIAGSQAEVRSDKLMTDAEYKAFLLQVEVALPKWEAALKSIDPEKDSQISYPLGKSIVSQRDVGLMEIGNIRQFVAKQRVKRTVYGELALHGFLTSVYDAMDSVVSFEVAGGLTPSGLEKYAPELSALDIRIGNDVNARVALLEKGSCQGALRNERLKRAELKDYPIPMDNDYRGVDGMWVPESKNPGKALVFPEQVNIDRKSVV